MVILHPIEYKEGIIWVDKSANFIKPCTLYSTIYGEVFEHNGAINIQQHLGSNVFVVKAQQNFVESFPNIPYVEIIEDIDDTSGMLNALETIHTGYRNYDFESGFEQGWKERGYKVTSVKKYTEEDLRRAIQLAKLSCSEIKDREGYYRDEYTENEIIKSLQPKIKSIEIELYTWEGEPVNWAPVTYQKDGKTYLKVKKVNYDNIS